MSEYQLDKIWKESPACMINWIRKHRKKIIRYVEYVNENISELIKELEK